MARHCKRFGVIFGALLALLWSPSAYAYEEQLSVDGAIGYGLLQRDHYLARQGASVDLGLSYGIWDAVVLRGTAGWGWLRVPDQSAYVGRFRVEGLYQIDVLKVVPFVGVGGALLAAAGFVAPGAHVALGLDYLASRAWTVGVDVRTGVLFFEGDLLRPTDVTLRLSRMIELY